MIKNKDELIKRLLYETNGEIQVGVIDGVDISDEFDEDFRKEILLLITKYKKKE